MRTLLYAMLSLGVGSGVGYVWMTQPHITEQQAQLKTTTEAALGVRRMLHRRGDLALTNLVIGIERDPGHRDFRGRLDKGGRLRPVFGQARQMCDTGVGAPECWQIAYMEVDGKPVTTTPDGAAPAGLIVPAPQDDLVTADIPPKDADPERAAPLNPRAVPETALARPTMPPKANAKADRAGIEPGTPTATHQVARPVINARSGPGTGNPVVTKLSAGDQLHLVGQDGGWGQFVIVGGDSAGARVWAALRIVEPLAPSQNP